MYVNVCFCLVFVCYRFCFRFHLKYRRHNFFCHLKWVAVEEEDESQEKKQKRKSEDEKLFLFVYLHFSLCTIFEFVCVFLKKVAAEVAAAVLLFVLLFLL